jgi:hypothetical protein
VPQSVWQEADALLATKPAAASVWDEADRVLAAEPPAPQTDLEREVVASSPASQSLKPTIADIFKLPTQPEIPSVPAPAPPPVRPPSAARGTAFQPPTAATVAGAARGAAAGVGDVLDAASGVLQAPVGALQALPAAAGEQLAGQSLPGHQNEPQTLFGRALEHLRMTARGQGGAVVPPSAFTPNPPDTGAIVSPTAAATARVRGTVPPQPEITPPLERGVEELTGRGLATAAKMLQDPAFIAMGLVDGAGEAVAAVNSAIGVKAAVDTAQNPNASPVDIAEGVVNALIASVPMGAQLAREASAHARVVAQRFMDDARAAASAVRENPDLGVSVKLGPLEIPLRKPAPVEERAALPPHVEELPPAPAEGEPAAPPPADVWAEADRVLETPPKPAPVDETLDRYIEKYAKGEPLGSPELRQAFEERSRVEDARAQLSEEMKQQIDQLLEEEPHAARAGEQPTGDLEEHRRTDTPRLAAEEPPADRGDRTLERGSDGGTPAPEEEAGAVGPVPPAVAERVPLTRVTRPGDPLESAGDRTWFVEGHLTGDEAAALNDMYTRGTGTLHHVTLPAHALDADLDQTDELGNRMRTIETAKLHEPGVLERVPQASAEAPAAAPAPIEPTHPPAVTPDDIEPERAHNPMFNPDAWKTEEELAAAIGPITAPNVALTDVDRNLANRAHGGTSWSPERRGAMQQREYVRQMQAVWTDLERRAKTPEQQQLARDAFEQYRQAWLRKNDELLYSRSRLLSVNVAGPSKFPGRQQQKRQDVYGRKLSEFVEWDKKAQRRLVETVAPSAARAISSDRDDAVQALEQKIVDARALHDRMRAGNGIVRNAKLTDDQKREQLRALGLSDRNIQLAMKPDYGRPGFPQWALTNNLANIRRMEQRIAEIKTNRATAARSATFDGGRVEENLDANRVQIFFDQKPDDALRVALKRNGFKWAPSLGVWQRQRNDAAVRAVEALLKVKLEAPAAAGATMEPSHEDQPAEREAIAAEGQQPEPGAAERPAPAEPGPEPGGQHPAGAQPRRPARADRAREAADAEKSGLDSLVEQAKAGGYAGDHEALRRELADRLQLIKEFDPAFNQASGHNPEHLLRAIAKAGGLSIKAETRSGRAQGGYAGEIKWLREFQDNIGGTRLHPRSAFGMVRGVANVFNERTGRSVDMMLEALRQDPEFQHIETLGDLVEEIRAAATADDPGLAIDRLAQGLGERWWESIGRAAVEEPPAEETHGEAYEPEDVGDVTFNPDELEAEGLDVNEFGEVQPRLPGASEARQAGKADTSFRAPVQASGDDFTLDSLTSDEVRERDAREAAGPSLFGEPEKPASPVPPKRSGGSGASMASTRTSWAKGPARAQVVPGLEEFVERDLVPTLKQAHEELGAAAEGVRAIWAPDTISAGAKAEAAIIRSNLAARRQRTARAAKAMQALERAWDKVPEAEQLAFAMAVDEGRLEDLPAAQRETAKLFKSINDQKRREANGLGGKVGYIEHYYPREWVRPGKVREFIQRALYGRRPLQGRGGFKKARARKGESDEIYSFRELYEAGFRPVETNPVRAHLRKWLEMDKWIAARRILLDGKRAGTTKFVRVGDDPPEGWQRYHDSFGTVYGPPTVTVDEAYDEILMTALVRFAEGLGIQHTRKVKVGGGAWGWAKDTTPPQVSRNSRGPRAC